MSSNQIERPASEMNEADDLPAFRGVVFGDQMCNICGSHLAVKGPGICTLCIVAANQQHNELMAFDPELSDILNGMGDSWGW